MAERNPFKINKRPIDKDEALLIDDVFTDAAELMDQLIKLESFCDPRCLALARTHLENAMLWVKQSAEVSQL